MFRKRHIKSENAEATPPAAPQTPYEKTMARAFRLLAAKPRGVIQLRERLLEKADESIVEQVINRLLELGYLNDESFASSFARSRLTMKPLGKTRLRQDLKRQQLDNQTVEQALETAYEEQSEESLIDRTIEKRLRLKGAPATREESKKLFDYLLRRGFGYELVLRKIRTVSKQAISEDE